MNFSFNSLWFLKSLNLIPLLDTLSSYAGPIPLPVVPIFLLPFFWFSLRVSIYLYIGRIRKQSEDIIKLEEFTWMPWLVIFSISFSRWIGSTTTPFPIIESFCLTIPLGNNDSLNVFLFITNVGLFNNFINTKQI